MNVKKGTIKLFSVGIVLYRLRVQVYYYYYYAN